MCICWSKKQICQTMNLKQLVDVVNHRTLDCCTKANSQLWQHWQKGSGTKVEILVCTPLQVKCSNWWITIPKNWYLSLTFYFRPVSNCTIPFNLWRKQHRSKKLMVLYRWDGTSRLQLPSQTTPHTHALWAAKAIRKDNKNENSIVQFILKQWLNWPVKQRLFPETSRGVTPVIRVNSWLWKWSDALMTSVRRAGHSLHIAASLTRLYHLSSPVCSPYQKSWK